MKFKNINWRVFSPPTLVLIFGIALTIVLWRQVDSYVQKFERSRFLYFCHNIVTEVEERLDDLSRLLIACRGLFDASVSVEYSEWFAFTRAIDYKAYHGMMGLGFIQRVPENEIDSFKSLVENDSGLIFNIHQLNTEPHYPFWYIIRYIEPLKSNLAARGLDIGSEPSRREAAEAAMKTGEIRLTKRISLVQDEKKIAGFLFFAPVYRTKRIPPTEAERFRELFGWTYMPIRISELMENILDTANDMLDFQIFQEKKQENPSTLLFDSTANLKGISLFNQKNDLSKDNPYYYSEITNFFGQNWTFYFKANKNFSNSSKFYLPNAVLISGSLLTILLSALIYSLYCTRQRALALANEMTKNLRTSESNLAAIFSSATDGIIAVNEKGMIEKFNPAAEKIFGYTLNDVIGKNFRMLITLESSNSNDSLFQQHSNADKKNRMDNVREVSGLRQDGSIFPMELAISSIEVENRVIFTCIIRDLTERKKIERMKSEFISTISHELRTPLTSIRGSLGLILGGVEGEISNTAKKLLDIASNNAIRLEHLINDILDVEKIESGKLKFNLNKQELVPLLQQAVQANQGYSLQYNVDLKVDILCNDLKIKVDADRFMQIMSNLLSNAVKFSPKNSCVTVRLSQRNEKAFIEVSDSGKGIPEEFRPNIFQKFSQADSSISRNKSGTGLGLSITKSLVESMNGQIGYESQINKGTTFWIELPLA